ncbi:MAG: HIRAN domain-containing protein [Candidatus Binatia bacterium]|nr:HIRAN domain-containing protein [Candidatus Binatia bacterium]
MRTLFGAWLRRAVGQRASAQEFEGPPGHEPLSVPVVGIAYEPRNELVRLLKLRDPVWLWREPLNPFDGNAIAVANERGVKFGHLSRRLAAILAGFMDQGHNPVPAVVTEVASDVRGGLLGLKVGFYLPEALVEQIQAAARPDIAYCFEIGQAGTKYLSLDCDEPTLHEVMERLQRTGYRCVRHAMSARAAIDGHQYRWYVVLEGDANEERVQEFFAREFGLVPLQRQLEERENEWMELFEQEKAGLQKTITELREELRQARAMAQEIVAQNRRTERQVRKAQREELPKLLTLLLPEIELLRDSLDVIAMELPSYEDVLGKLRLLATAPNRVRAKRVQTAPEWSELRYSTGRGDDGRLYFKRVQDRYAVLVSLKTQQERDMAYLKKH